MVWVNEFIFIDSSKTSLSSLLEYSCKLSSSKLLSYQQVFVSSAYFRFGWNWSKLKVFFPLWWFNYILVPFFSWLYFCYLFSVFDWSYVNRFVHAIPDWRLIFDLNVLQRTNNSWDPNINASTLLVESFRKGYCLSGLELGNGKVPLFYMEMYPFLFFCVYRSIWKVLLFFFSSVVCCSSHYFFAYFNWISIV